MKKPNSHHLLPLLRATLLLLTALIVSPGPIQSQDDREGASPNDFRKRGRRGPDSSGPNMQRPGELRLGNRTVQFPAEFRTIDGFGNNQVNTEWGAIDSPFLRLTTVDYADGVNEPSGEDRPNARAVSNAVVAQEEDMPSRFGATDYVWQWGQFLDHDIVLTPIDEPSDPFNIAVPAGDPWFDPARTGSAEIDLDRSFAVNEDGYREQINEITAFVDASNVYGSDEERATALRANDGTGRLLVSEGNLLPFNTEGLPNAPSEHAVNFFIAGDFRANEQVALLSIHTLFVREHNHWADAIRRSNPRLDGDQIYEAARAIVGAEMQVITYREFLPRLLGEDALPRYRGYRRDANPTIANVFATASYRFGHSMLSSQLLRVDRRGREIDEGHLDLADAFFSPDRIANEGGIDPILRGLAAQTAQEIDTRLVDDVRNFLFGPPGAGGFDLASLNIQRGRDHGLPGYNEVRRNFGLKEADDFDDVTPNRDLAEDLEDVYGDVEKLDIWVGGLAEPPVRGAMVGETIRTVLSDQFRRLRDGDRFWYENHFNEEMQRLLEQQTLARIVRRNTDIDDELPENLWQGEKGRPGRLTDGRLTDGRGPGGGSTGGRMGGFRPRR